MPQLPDLRHLFHRLAVRVEPSAQVHGHTFSGKVGELVATVPAEVLPALKALESRVASGLHAAGFLSYEAASALNGDLCTRAAGELPLLWFALYETRDSTPLPPCGEPFLITNREETMDRERYTGAVAAVRELIEAGDCYQVNLTMRQRFSFAGSPRAFFHELCLNQPTPYNSYLECGRYRVLSASPELFFSLTDGVLTTRPMKGTAGRGRWFEEDEELKRRLRENPKELAENLMIVDLLRNDMGMVSQTGSVRVASLFDVETHATVHQMTSTIKSRLSEGVGVTELLQALFPCGSVTGAPKRRSMEIIADLEGEPRGLYTGGIGYLSPGGEARFSVAIRTAVLDQENGRGEIGLGSGITYDSNAAAEYAESLSKGRFAVERAPEFHLIESLLYDDGYFLLEEHLERLASSAAYFSFPLDRDRALRLLEETARGLAGAQKVRLLLFKDGRLYCEAATIAEQAPEATAAFAREPIDSADPFLYHKTSRREHLVAASVVRPDVTEVIFSNERGEVTEGVNSNIVALIDGAYLTPPLDCGLLPGVFRGSLLATGQIRERVLTRHDLKGVKEVYLINSVRKWRRVQLVE